MIRIDTFALLSRGEVFTQRVCSFLGTDPPRFEGGLLNKRLSSPLYRGVFFPERGRAGPTIVVALDYDFRGEEDVERTVKHEVVEFFTYLVRGKVVSRWDVSHSVDPLYLSLRRALNRYYPDNPEGYARVVQKKLRGGKRGV